MNDFRNIVADIAYHDYIAYIAHMDNELDQEHFVVSESDEKKSETYFTQGNYRFDKLFREYGNGLTGFASDFANPGLKSKFSKPLPKGYTQLASHLYNPASFVTFGNTDSVNLVAVDSLEFILRLSPEHDIPTKLTCTAFLPKLKSLGIKNKSSVKAFCCFKDIFSETEHFDDEYHLPSHTFIESRPLLGVSYFKLNGFALLGPGLLFQQAAFKAMAACINRALITLETGFDRFGKIYNQDDLQSFRCVFLDPQDWSDIALIMFCKNYSIISSILLELRNLKFKDLYNEDDFLCDAVKQFEIHEIVEKIYSDNTTYRSGDMPFENNPIFQASSTTLGISYKAYSYDSNFCTSEIPYSGLAYSDTHFTIMPGSIGECSNELVKENENNSREEIFNRSEKEEFSLVSVGEFDFSKLSINKNSHHYDNLCSLDQNILNIKSFRKRINSEDKLMDLAEGIDICEKILDTWTELYIPTPDLSVLRNAGADPVSNSISLMNNGSEYRSIPVDNLLYAIKVRLFEKDRLIEKNLRSHELSFENIEKEMGWLSIENLRRAIRILRIPTPLSSQILRLFSDFAKSLRNPLVFDRVLDMLDIFATTYMLFTKKLQSMPKNEISNLGDNVTTEDVEHIYLSTLSAQNISDLEELFNLIELSLLERTNLNFKEYERWHKTLNIKGGLYKLVCSAEVPLTANVGILRKVLNGETCVFNPVSVNKSRCIVGSSTIFSYNPRATSRSFSLGIEEPYCLAALELNITYLMRPGFLHIYFHEIAHIIWNLLQNQLKTSENAKVLDNILYKHLYRKLETDKPKGFFERIEEIFAEMFVHYIIYSYSNKVYYRNYIAQYFIDPISTSKNDNDTKHRLKEILIRGYLVTELVKPRDDSVDPDLRRFAAKNFEEAIFDAGRFFPEFARYFSDKEFRKFVVDEYIDIRFKERDTYNAISGLWVEIKECIDQIMHDKLNISYPIEPTENVDFVKQFYKAYSKGKPIIRIKGKLNSDKIKADPDKRRHEKYGHIHTLFLVKKLLQIHMNYLYSDFNHDDDKSSYLIRKHSQDENLDLGLASPFVLPRNIKKMRLSDDHIPVKGWNRMVMDRSYNGFFSTDLSIRRESLKRRISIIKTFWDISTNIKARRFKHILYKAWPEYIPTELKDSYDMVNSKFD